MTIIKRYFLVPSLLMLLAFWFMIGNVQAQQAYNPLYQSVPVTPDLTIGASATSGVAFTGAPIRWIAIKNDCASPIFFNLRGPATTQQSSTAYGLRLNAGETFSMPVNMFSLGVSAGAGNSATCTYTVQAGK